MNTTLQIGPLALPVSVLVIFLAIGLATFVGKRIGHKAGLNTEPAILWITLVSLACARMAFVWQYRDAYFSEPFSIIDIRDGGWSPLAGFVTAGMYVALAVMRRSVMFKALLGAFATGTAIYVGALLFMDTKHQVVQPLPEVTLAAIDGSTIALNSYQGKPVVVNLWATWCPPCQREMPVLERAQQDNPDMHFVFVNQGETAGHVAQFLQKNQLILDNMLLDAKGDIARHFGQRGLPATLFFNAQGHLVSSRLGELSHATLARRLESITPQPHR